MLRRYQFPLPPSLIVSKGFGSVYFPYEHSKECVNFPYPLNSTGDAEIFLAPTYAFPFYDPLFANHFEYEGTILDYCARAIVYHSHLGSSEVRALSAEKYSYLISTKEKMYVD